MIKSRQVYLNGDYTIERLIEIIQSKRPMEIINVTEIINGIASAPVSFPIFDDSQRDRIVKEAEELFSKLAKENGSDESEWDINELLDSGEWDNQNGYNVIINWSEVKYKS